MKLHVITKILLTAVDELCCTCKEKLALKVKVFLKIVILFTRIPGLPLV